MELIAHGWDTTPDKHFQSTRGPQRCLPGVGFVELSSVTRLKMQPGQIKQGATCVSEQKWPAKSGG